MREGKRVETGPYCLIGSQSRMDTNWTYRLVLAILLAHFLVLKVTYDCKIDSQSYCSKEMNK